MSAPIGDPAGNLPEQLAAEGTRVEDVLLRPGASTCGACGPSIRRTARCAQDEPPTRPDGGAPCPVGAPDRGV